MGSQIPNADTDVRIKRRTTQWLLEHNPVFGDGEPVYDIDQGTITVGDGVRPYSAFSGSRFSIGGSLGASDAAPVFQDASNSFFSPYTADPNALPTIAPGNWYVEGRPTGYQYDLVGLCVGPTENLKAGDKVSILNNLDPAVALLFSFKVLPIANRNSQTAVVIPSGSFVNFEVFDVNGSLQVMQLNETASQYDAPLNAANNLNQRVFNNTATALGDLAAAGYSSDGSTAPTNTQLAEIIHKYFSAIQTDFLAINPGFNSEIG